MSKIDLEFVRNSFEKDGYTLLSKEYINAKQKLEYLCPNNHSHSTTWGNWYTGHRCPYCAGQIKPELREIRLLMLKEGYVLLSEEYKSNKQNLDYICPKNHKHSIRWNSWKTGRRCPYCAGQGKPTMAEVRRSFKEEGYTLLDTEYKNSKSKLRYICPNGHLGTVTWDDWKSSGNRCGHCANNIRHTIEHVKALLEEEGYILLSKEYKNNRTKLNYVCSNGHKHSIRLDDWRMGCRCPTCYAIRISGPGNYNWQGGISYEPYCPIWKDSNYKGDIKDRDGCKCLNPYCTSDSPKDLVIHHINFNKKDCNPKNLITICRSCNNKANKDREWHTAWYQAIINRRYNYK